MIPLQLSNIQLLLRGGLVLFWMLPAHGAPPGTLSRQLLQATCSDPLMDSNCKCPGTLIEVNGLCTCPANSIRASDYACQCNENFRPVDSLTTPGLYSCNACDSSMIVSCLAYMYTLLHL